MNKGRLPAVIAGSIWAQAKSNSRLFEIARKRERRAEANIIRRGQTYLGIYTHFDRLNRNQTIGGSPVGRQIRMALNDVHIAILLQGCHLEPNSNQETQKTPFCIILT